MPDKLFERFASPENLKLAYKYVKSEVEGSTLPLDPFWVPAIRSIERLEDAFFNSLSRLLLESKYKPEDAYFFHQHKENYAIRRIAMLTVVDRIVYQALLNPKILGIEVSQNIQPSSYYPRPQENKDTFLEDYQPKYEQFWEDQENTFEKGFNYRGEYDVSSYFDHIRHDQLLMSLERRKIGSPQLRNLLLKCLASWHKQGVGLPQGPEASSQLANLYLTEVDQLFEDPDSPAFYFRYMDDMVIMVQNEQTLLAQIELLTSRLDRLGLNLNAKTKCEQIDADFFEQNVNYSPYGSRIEEPIEPKFWTKVQNEISRIVFDLHIGEPVSKQDMSMVKYFLKADQDYEYVSDFIRLYPQLPSCADKIARYINPVASTDKYSDQLENVWHTHHLFRWQKLWLLKLLLLHLPISKSRNLARSFLDSDSWELRAISALSLTEKDKQNNDFLEKTILKAEHTFEESMYVSLLSQHPNVTNNRHLLEKYSGSESVEMQVVALAQLLSDEQIAKLSQRDDLLFTRHDFIDVPAKGFKAVEVEEMLGFKIADNSTQKYFFEISLAGNEIVMHGTVFRGKTYPVLKSKTTSAYSRLLQGLLELHQNKNSLIHASYTSVEVNNVLLGFKKKDSVETIDIVKEKRKLSEPCRCLIDHLLSAGYNKSEKYLRFRTAMSIKEFNDLPQSMRKQFVDEVKKLILSCQAE